jgi:sec-independent protein translocase protein TatA
MGSFSAWHWIIVALVILVLFGRGKISETMGDFGKGLKSFRKGMEDEDKRHEQAPPQQVTQQNGAAPSTETHAAERSSQPADQSKV